MTAKYVGVKMVEAWEQERDGKPGYEVKYEDGYVSRSGWRPGYARENAAKAKRWSAGKGRGANDTTKRIGA